jgi:hypothetical protein
MADKPRGGILDPEIWKRAEREAKKGNPDDLGAVTRKIYVRMGGRTSDSMRKADPDDPHAGLEALLKARGADERLRALVEK